MVEARRRLVYRLGEMQNSQVLLMSEAASPSMDVETERKKLRQRWELASVLNFLDVFKSVIGNDLKISAEDIEIALIKPNDTLAKLHVTLLKALFPVSKTQKDPDAWMINVKKILSNWWPWVSEGDFPLTCAKGEEASVYMKLEPANRLLILKALCELRLDQDDAVSYINKALKNHADVSTFRMEKLAADGPGISFWYDGNETIGYRLYKEVKQFEKKPNGSKITIPAMNYRWETLATNLEEFKEIVIEYASSKIKSKVALSKSIAADIIPALEKLLKKKVRAQQRQYRMQMFASGFRSYGITRSCRNQKPIDYTFDDYDKSIKDAIQYVNNRKASEEPRQEDNPRLSKKRKETTLKGSSSSDGKSSESDSEQVSDEEINFREQRCRVTVKRSKGLRFSKRLAGIPNHAIPESMNLFAKNRLRQRPNLNTAIETAVVPDSEDESVSEDKF